MRVKRFGVSLEEDMMLTLDSIVKEKQFPNRSRAIRHMIKESAFADRVDKNKIVAGVIVLAYDHHRRDLNNKLLKAQHDFHQLVLSTQHVHLSHDVCLETIAVKGKAHQLLSLADKIIGIKGIKHGKFVMTDIE